ncbi:MarR family transcriptional regulator [uncultured Algimonas sp.]|uniref:MarR family winged helix-turn-helix transcriptional regulator n=1 Tax=uncultured Algimonas sp. TaxID=1547920 RepID=UPI00261B0243|nr:MarR family transcriptional regulator [uncultured Algimonas sp.]
MIDASNAPGLLRVANLFGAVSQAVDDAVSDAISSQSPSNISPAALSLVGHAEGITIAQIGRALGLSHPGTVRLVDRMVAAGLAERKTSPADARAVSVHLTAEGRELAQQVAVKRLGVIGDLISGLDPTEQETLASLADRILTTSVNTFDAGVRVCRLCEPSVCTDCPVEPVFVSHTESLREDSHAGPD